MIFTISKDVFEDNSESNIRTLYKIWLQVDERHRMYISDEIESLLNCEWFKSLRKPFQDEIKEHIAWSGLNPQPASLLKISNESSDNFSTIEAYEILSTPLTLILENAENDAHFIRAIVKNFKGRSKNIAKHLQKGWLKFGMGGGTTILDLIKAEQDRFETGAIQNYTA